MRRFAKNALLLAGILVGASRHAAAQPAQPHDPVDRAPRFEVAVIGGGLWSLDRTGQSGRGARFTANRTSWLATEASFDTRPADADVPRRESVLILNARAQVSDEHGYTGYLTAGFAACAGLDRPFAPMIGLGLGKWHRQIISWRAEVQAFPGGTMHRGYSRRVTVSIALAIP